MRRNQKKIDVDAIKRGQESERKRQQREHEELLRVCRECEEISGGQSAGKKPQEKTRHKKGNGGKGKRQARKPENGNLAMIYFMAMETARQIRAEYARALRR